MKIATIGSVVGALAFLSVAAAPAHSRGANVPGPHVYSSTCPTQVDCLPSGNGNGNGNRKQPAAGSVGKADNKYPPGQYPGPEDDNNGYECDGNMGIALGNPAHSGCDGGQS